MLPLVVHPVPRDLDWSYVLGSAVLTAFLLQVVTGVALAMNYVPATNAAFESLRFITEQAPFGRLVRGIHYWGATAMVVLVFAHLVQVFLIAAYKFPRELNWVSGSLLLLVTLALAFTGQLLRWEQNAFWSIVIAAEQAGKTPVIGAWLMQLILAGWTIGPATLTRFYATHVFLLPALVFLFVGVHLYLVIHHGISDPPRAGRPVNPRTYRAYYEALLRRGEPFFPNSFWRDAFGAVVLTLVVVALAATVGPPPIEEAPDPTVVQLYPRPDWYFLWYFALLALIPHSAETVVIIGFPLLVGVVLLGLPFLANRGERAPSRRPWAVASVVLMFVGFVALTVQGLRAPWSPILQNYDQIPLPAQALANLSPDAQRGAAGFQRLGCHACHAIGGQGGQAGPSLSGIGSRHDRDYFVTTILRGRGNMPSYAGTIQRQDLEDVVSFLQSLQGP